MDRPGNAEHGALKLIGLLLALNLGVFLAGMALQRWSPPATEAQVYNAEKIRLLALPVLPAARNPAQLASPASAPAAAEETGAEMNLRCLSWASLDLAALNAIEARLQQAGIVADAYEIELEKPLGWWVYLPPVPSKLELQARIEALQRLAIADFAPVRGGSMRNAISLGAFAKLAQARARAASLTKQGIQDVKYGPRPEAGLARLIVSDAVPAAALAKLNAVWSQDLQPARCRND